MCFAGIPPTIEYRATSFVTTERDVIIAPFPMVTPLGISTPSAIHTSLPILT